MKIVNDSIKNALKQPTTQRKGRILVDGKYYEVFNVEYYADAYNEGNVIGNAIASQLDFDLPYMPKFETFKYFDGVWTGTNYEYIDMGTFHVFDEQDEDDFNKHITAFDNLIKFNVPFQDVGGYPKKLFHELQNICNQAGVGLKNTNIPNGNFEVVNNQFTNGESLKTVLKAICQLAGMYAIIKNDEVVLQLKNQTNEVINKKQHEPTIWKRRSYGINQVILGLSDVEGEYVIREDKNDIEQNGVHKLVINDNPFAYTETKRDELIDELFNQVRGFGYIPYEVKGEWLNYLEIGDTIIIDDVETIVLRINGKSPKALESMMSAPAIIDSSVEYVNNTNTVKNQLIRTEISVDKQNQQIEAVVSQTDEQNQKIAKVTQTVDELNSKISDIADITISGEDTDAQVELDNINESEPIRLVIRPIGESISYLYPRDNLFPSDTLFFKNRKVRFTNTKTNEIVDYELPMDLLYYNSEHYDEFILDYEGQTCMVNKRVGYNTDGTTYVLDNEQIIECDEYPRILLTEGDYKVQVLGYDTAYIFVRLMAQNIYTTQFYTKAETDSIISQTSQSIDLSVNKKLSNYSTSTEINAQLQLKVDSDELISEINASADVINLKSDRLIIDSTNFKLTKDGTITANAGTFGGTINTNKDLTVGNNVYIGQNQSPSVINEKYLRFTDNIYFKRISVGSGAETLSLYTPMFGINSGNYGFSISDGGYSRIDAEYITLDAGEYVTLSTDGSWLDVSNEQITVNRNITNISDERLKQNIEDIDISWVDELKLKEFEYKSTPNKKQIGLIAQDYLNKDYSKYFIEKIKIPNDEQEYYGISYGNITNALIKYCQELKQEINTLKNEINSLKESEK